MPIDYVEDGLADLAIDPDGRESLVVSTSAGYPMAWHRRGLAGRFRQRAEDASRML